MCSGILTQIRFHNFEICKFPLNVSFYHDRPCLFGFGHD